MEKTKVMTANEFLLSGDFIPNPSSLKWDNDDDIQGRMLWDDWDECNKLVSEMKEKGEYPFIYTVIMDEGKDWISEGMWRMNRTGYLFSRTKVEVPEDYSIEYFA